MRIAVKNEIKILQDCHNYKRARFWFWPVVVGITIIFGLFEGIKGAFVGFFYGVAVGLFLIHESLSVKKK
jgi:Mg2+/citrate symporter